MKSARSLYEHSNRFTEVKKLKSTVYVCSLNPCKVSMSTLQGLCTQKLRSTVLTLLTSYLCQSMHHDIIQCVCVSVCVYVCLCMSVCLSWILVTIEETKAQRSEEFQTSWSWRET